MKKMFIIALILLASAFQFARPSLQVSIDNDVGICYVAPIDQSIEVVAGSITVNESDLWSPEILDVEESGIVYFNTNKSNSQSKDLAMYRFNSTASYGTQSQPINNRRDLGGLDTGSILPRAGVNGQT